MNKEISGVITFKSTHHTIKFEEFLKNKNINFKTIPTPREITRSCGLAIVFDLEDLPKVNEIIANNEINIDSVYKYTKDGTNRRAEKII